MQYIKKMSLIPYQSGGGSNPQADFQPPPDASPAETPKVKSQLSNSIRRYARDRQTKILKVVLKLAKNGLYDHEGMFSLRNGEKFDIVEHLMHCASPGRSIKGLDQFVDLLHKAGVDPDDIINHNVREMLLRKTPGPRASSINEKTSASSMKPLPDNSFDQSAVDASEREVRFASPISLEQLPPPPPLVRYGPVAATAMDVSKSRRGVKRKMFNRDETQEEAAKIHKSNIWDPNDSDLD